MTMSSCLSLPPQLSCEGLDGKDDPLPSGDAEDRPLLSDDCLLSIPPTPVDSVVVPQVGGHGVVASGDDDLRNLCVAQPGVLDPGSHLCLDLHQR